MLLAYLRRQRAVLLLLAAVVGIFAAVFSLYDLPAEPVGYAALLCLVPVLIGLTIGWLRYRARHRALAGLARRTNDPDLPLPPPGDRIEADYQALLRGVCADRAKLAARDRARIEDLLDYFTLWAHQIKTPIAAAHLLLQEQGRTAGPEVDVELQRIEQYVEMVLGYLRLGSDSTDYVLREVPLDPLLRQTVRRFAKQFVLKKIALDLAETGRTVLSDEKWLGFVLAQVLSNALKYTPAGGHIRIWAEGDALLIADDGIGIRAEDLPRVFEKGFTGYNGRQEHRSTGIGLYLCRQVMDRLGHGISLTARPGAGTCVQLDLARAKQIVE